MITVKYRLCWIINYVSYDLLYSSQIVETGAICLEFSPNFLHSLFTPLFPLKCAPLLPQCWAERIFKHWSDCKPKSALGRGKSHKCFNISDEHCRSNSKFPLKKLKATIYVTFENENWKKKKDNNRDTVYFNKTESL